MWLRQPTPRPAPKKCSVERSNATLSVPVCVCSSRVVRPCACCHRSHGPPRRQLTATITSLPTVGTLYQLSQVFSDYGYEPKRGVPLTTPGVVLGSKNRLLYVPPPFTNAPDGSVRDHGLYYDETVTLSRGVVRPQLWLCAWWARCCVTSRLVQHDC